MMRLAGSGRLVGINLCRIQFDQTVDIRYDMVKMFENIILQFSAN